MEDQNIKKVHRTYETVYNRDTKTKNIILRTKSETEIEYEEYRLPKNIPMKNEKLIPCTYHHVYEKCQYDNSSCKRSHDNLSPIQWVAWFHTYEGCEISNYYTEETITVSLKERRNRLLTEDQKILDNKIKNGEYNIWFQELKKEAIKQIESGEFKGIDYKKYKELKPQLYTINKYHRNPQQQNHGQYYKKKNETQSDLDGKFLTEDFSTNSNEEFPPMENKKITDLRPNGNSTPWHRITPEVKAAIKAPPPPENDENFEDEENSSDEDSELSEKDIIEENGRIMQVIRPEYNKKSVLPITSTSLSSNDSQIDPVISIMSENWADIMDEDEDYEEKKISDEPASVTDKNLKKIFKFQLEDITDDLTSYITKIIKIVEDKENKIKIKEEELMKKEKELKEREDNIKRNEEAAKNAINLLKEKIKNL